MKVNPFKFNDTDIFFLNLMGELAEAEHFRTFSPENRLKTDMKRPEMCVLKSSLWDKRRRREYLGSLHMKFFGDQ